MELSVLTESAPTWNKQTTRNWHRQRISGSVKEKEKPTIMLPPDQRVAPAHLPLFTSICTRGPATDMFMYAGQVQSAGQCTIQRTGIFTRELLTIRRTGLARTYMEKAEDEASRSPLHETGASTSPPLRIHTGTTDLHSPSLSRLPCQRRPW